MGQGTVLGVSVHAEKDAEPAHQLGLSALR